MAVDVQSTTGNRIGFWLCVTAGLVCVLGFVVFIVKRKSRSWSIGQDRSEEDYVTTRVFDINDYETNSDEDDDCDIDQERRLARESVPGLKCTSKFLKHVKVRNMDVSELEGKLTVYRMLRKVDLEGFKRLLKRQDYEFHYTKPPPLHLALLNHTALLIGLALTNSSIPHFLQFLWVSISIWGWFQHSTIICVNLDAYYVHGDHDNVAPVHYIIRAQLLDILFLITTGGYGILLSLGLIASLDSRQSIGDILFGVKLRVAAVEGAEIH